METHIGIEEWNGMEKQGLDMAWHGMFIYIKSSVKERLG